MLLSLLKFMRGYLILTVTGASAERFLNLCCKKNILIWNLTPCKEEKGFRFCMSLPGYMKTKDIQKRTHTKVRIQNKCGLPFLLYHHRYRKLFVVGLVSAAILIFYSSAFVWKVEINGVNSLSSDTILCWLESEHQSYGTRKKDINCSALEAKLRNTFHNIAWTSVKIEGTKLTVDITESLPIDKQVVLPGEGAWDIVSKEQAVITKICTRSGKPLVEKGDGVSPGAILVSGELEILNDSGEVSNYQYVVSDADVYGLVRRQFKKTIPRTYQKKVRTGQQTTNYVVKIGKWSFPFQLKRNQFHTCDTICEDYQLRLLGEWYLPVHFIRSEQQEYYYEEKKYTKQEITKIAKEEWNLFLKNFTEKGIPILAKNVKIETNSNDCVVVGTVDVELSLVNYSPTKRTPFTRQETVDDT